MYHAQYTTWDQGDTTAYATNGAGLPIHLIGFDIASGVTLRAGVEYVISICILDSAFTNGFAGVTQFPGEVMSAIQVSEQIPAGWHYTSDTEFNRFSGGVCTRLVSEPDNCPQDPNKTEPGICGCGVDDNADSDGDGVPDCIDQCAGVDDATFAPGCVGAIPTVSEWGLVIMALLLLILAKIRFLPCPSRIFRPPCEQRTYRLTTGTPQLPFPGRG